MNWSLLALALQGEFGFLATPVAAGLIAGLTAYGANRFFLGALSAQVKNHGERLFALEDDAKRCGEDRGYIKGHLNI